MEGYPPTPFYLKFLRLGGVEATPPPRKFYVLFLAKMAWRGDRVVNKIFAKTKRGSRVAELFFKLCYCCTQLCPATLGATWPLEAQGPAPRWWRGGDW